MVVNKHLLQLPVAHCVEDSQEHAEDSQEHDESECLFPSKCCEVLIDEIQPVNDSMPPCGIHGNQMVIASAFKGNEAGLLLLRNNTYDMVIFPDLSCRLTIFPDLSCRLAIFPDLS